MKLITTLLLFSIGTIADDNCGYKFSFDLKYDNGEISYDGGYFNLKKSFCDTSKPESSSNFIVQLTDGEKKFQKRIFISPVVYNEVIKGSKIKIDNMKQRAIYRQVQFAFPKEFNNKEVSLRVSNLNNETLLKQKIKISDK